MSCSNCVFSSRPAESLSSRLRRQRSCRPRLQSDNSGALSVSPHAMQYPPVVLSRMLAHHAACCLDIRLPQAPLLKGLFVSEKPTRRWQEIADEASREQDPERLQELSEEPSVLWTNVPRVCICVAILPLRTKVLIQPTPKVCGGGRPQISSDHLKGPHTNGFQGVGVSASCDRQSPSCWSFRKEWRLAGGSPPAAMCSSSDARYVTHN